MVTRRPATVWIPSIAGVAAIAVLASIACGEQPRQGSATAPASSAAAQPPLPESGPTPGMGAPGAPLLVPMQVPAATGLAWSAPQGWEVQTPSSSMRRAQYGIPPAQGDAETGECAVFYFGAGQGGDAQANVQRWAAQFKGPGGPPPAPNVTQVKVGSLAVTRVEIQGTYEQSGMGAPGGGEKPGYMLLGAIVPGPDANWYFKCTGPRRTMEASRAQFDQMIASVRAIK